MAKLRDFRQFCLNSELTELAAGHPNAFGVSFTDENLKKFIDWSNEQLADFDFTPSYDVDFVYTADDFNGNDILDVAAMKQWELENQKPIISRLEWQPQCV